MKILATADWHIGTSIVGQTLSSGKFTYSGEDGYIDFDTRLPPRTHDFLRAVGEMITLAREYKPDLILHAGDVFKSNKPSHPAERAAAALMKQLADIAPTVLIPGNHDITAHGSAIDAWRELAPSNLHVETMPSVVRLPNCNVVAIPWLTSRHLAEFGKSKTRAVQELGNAIEMMLEAIVANLDEKPKILLAHATAFDGKMGEYRPTVLGNDLLWPGGWFEAFDLVCLGHIHKHQIVYKEPYAFYPGSPERCTFGEKDEPKGFYTIELGSEPIFHDLQTRPMIQLEGTPEEITAQLKNVPDEAMLKIKVHLGPDEPFEMTSRWFHLVIEEIRPRQERETRLGSEARSLDMLSLLTIYLKEVRGHDDERIFKLLDRAEKLREEHNGIC